MFLHLPRATISLISESRADKSNVKMIIRLCKSTKGNVARVKQSANERTNIFIALIEARKTKKM